MEKALNTNKLYELLRIPSCNPLRAVIGWDYGEAPDPTTFIVAIQNGDNEPWQTYCRISLYGVPSPRQLEVLRHIVENIINRKLVMLSMDNKVLYPHMLEDEYRPLFENRIKLTQFNSTVEIDTVTGKMITDNNKNDPVVLEHRADGKIVKDWRKYLLTETLKRYMLNFLYGDLNRTRLELGYDAEMETELLGTIERRTDRHVVYDVPRQKSSRNNPKPDQLVDGLRALTDSILLYEAEKPDTPNIDESGLLAQMGWSGSKTNHGTIAWKAPWSIGRQ